MMGITQRRKLRRRVVSRLTWAWLSAFSMLAVLGGIFFLSLTSNRGVGRIALSIDKVEHLARAAEAAPEAEERLQNPAQGLRLAAPVLRDGDPAGGPVVDSVEGVEGEDFLLYPEEFDVASAPDEDITSDEVVITIDGQTQGAAPITMASLTPGIAPIHAVPNPDPSLMRTTPLGKIPRIAADGRKAQNFYARHFDNPNGSARIAVIVGGLGLNRALTERAIDDLPPEISLAFAPYAKDLPFWTAKARKAGHEVLIELPMESYGANQAALGAAGLLSSHTPQQNLQRLDWLLSRFGGYFAATNYMGAKFSTDNAALTPILQKLRDSGVAYIDDTGAVRTAGDKSGATWTTVNRMIPPAPDDSGRRAVRRELRALEKIANRDGAALGKTYAYAATLDEIATWAADLEDKDLVAAPASSVLQARGTTR